jgi:uncharacterized protein YwgA
MTIKDAITETIYRSPDQKVFGRATLQKKLYFVAVAAREDFGHVPQFYGPFSSRVADELDALVHAGFVLEDQETPLEVESRFGERRRYCYRLSQAARETLYDREAERGRYAVALERLLDHWVARNPDLLLVAAKIHCAALQHSPASAALVRQALATIEWPLSELERDQIVRFFEHLDIIPSEERAILAPPASEVLVGLQQPSLPPAVGAIWLPQAPAPPQPPTTVGAQ